MITWPARVFVNTVYAFLAAEADDTDRVSIPTYVAAGADEDDVVADSRRTALDAWLDEPTGREKAEQDALVKYLTG